MVVWKTAHSSATCRSGQHGLTRQVLAMQPSVKRPCEAQERPGDDGVEVRPNTFE